MLPAKISVSFAEAGINAELAGESKDYLF